MKPQNVAKLYLVAFFICLFPIDIGGKYNMPYLKFVNPSSHLSGYAPVFGNNLYIKLCIFWQTELVVFKINKTTSKYLNEQEHWQSENEEFEAFETVVFLLLYIFFHSIDKPYNWLTRICRKIFFNSLLEDKWPEILISRTFFLTIPGYNLS